MPMRVLVMQQADGETDDDGEDAREDRVDREVDAADRHLAAETRGDLVGQPGDAVALLDRLDDDEREAEGEQEVVERVELEQPSHEQALHEHPEAEHDDRHDHEGRPEADAQLGEQHRCDDGAEHVAGAVREVDDPEHAEDDGQAECGQCVEATGREALQRVLDECAHVARSGSSRGVGQPSLQAGLASP